MSHLTKPVNEHFPWYTRPRSVYHIHTEGKNGSRPKWESIEQIRRLHTHAFPATFSSLPFRMHRFTGVPIQRIVEHFLQGGTHGAALRFHLVVGVRWRTNSGWVVSHHCNSYDRVSDWIRDNRFSLSYTALRKRTPKMAENKRTVLSICLDTQCGR